MRWKHKLEQVIGCMQLSSGEASKLSGQLQWGSQHIFRRLGRAMIRPIYAQIRSRRPNFNTNSELMIALEWWHE
eukprot:6414446-Karenia_brevis.AAC.1